MQVLHSLSLNKDSTEWVLQNIWKEYKYKRGKEDLF